MSRRHRPLVSESRHGLDQVKARLQHVSDPEQAKFSAAASLGIPLQRGYNGQLTAHDAGRIGGSLGGQMVKELTALAMEQLASKQKKE